MMNCQRFQELLPAYLAEELGEDERTVWRGHLLGCSRCRVAALEEDPSLLFVLARRDDSSGERSRACADAVVASIRTGRLERTLRSRRRPWLAAAAAAILAIGGGVAFHGLERPQPAAVPAPAVARSQVAAPEVDVENEGADVRVYQLASDEKTNVTYVVDPSLRL